jgi:hypothetical protein
MWRVSLTLQHMNYFTRWYSSHLHTQHEAVEKFTDEVLGQAVTNITGVQEALEQVKTALIFLEAQE